MYQKHPQLLARARKGSVKNALLFGAVVLLALASCTPPGTGGTPSSTKEITAFSIVSPAATGVIAGLAITVSVPSGTGLTALVPQIVTTGASVKVGSTTVTSGVTALNFTNAVTFTVTAEDGTTNDYVVLVTATSPTSKAITAFGFASPAATGTITESSHTVAVTVPSGTDVTALVPTIVISGASVSPASGVAQNFTSPVTYTVHAGDLSTQAYVVTVTVASTSAKAITGFGFASPAVAGTVTEGTHTVAVTVPFGTNVTALVPSITITGGSITPASGVAQNFSSPVTYTVHATDLSTQSYVVTVTVALDPAKDIQSFGFHAPSVVGAISGTSITVDIPFGYDITHLQADFTLSGGTATVSAVTQAAGTTYNDFSSPVTYLITAADSSTQSYTVTARFVLNAATYSGTGVSGYVNTAGGAPQYSALRNVVSDGSILYVADGNNTIRKIVKSSGTVTTIAGTAGSTTNVDNTTGTAASFRTMDGLTINPAGTALYVVSDAIGKSVVRKIVLSGNFPVTTLATLAAGSQASGVAADENGNVFVADGYNGMIYKVTSAGTISTLAGDGATGIRSMVNGTGAAAEFQYPRSLVYGGSATDTLYVSDYKIRKIVISTGVVTTVSNSNALSSGSPYGITYDATSNLIYVSDKYGYKLRMISLVTGVAATVAGTGASGSNNVTAGLGSDVSFNQFEGLTVDPMDHDLFIADYGNFVVRHLY